MKRWFPSALLAAYAAAATAGLIALYRVGIDSGGRSDASDSAVSLPADSSAGSVPAPRSTLIDYASVEDPNEDDSREAVPDGGGDVHATREVVFLSDDGPSAGDVSDSLREEAILITAAAAQRERERAELRRMPATDLTYSDILLLAEAVDHEANSRLREVARKYNLDEGQQDRAFRIFAGASTAYHPVLGEQSDAGLPEDETLTAVPNESGDQKVVDELIHDLLDEEQQEDFEDEWVDRDLWWTEIVGQLSDDLDDEQVAPPEDTGDGGDDTTEEESEPEDHLGGNLFDLLGQ